MGSRALCLDLSKGLCTSSEEDNIRSTLLIRPLDAISVNELSPFYLGEEDSGGLSSIKSDPDASKPLLGTYSSNTAAGAGDENGLVK